MMDVQMSTIKKLLEQQLTTQAQVGFHGSDDNDSGRSLKSLQG